MSTLGLFTRCVTAAAVLVAAATAQAADWFPVPVKITAPDGKVTMGEYQGQTKAQKDWSICVSYPHMKDPFFVASDYGVVEEAKRLGVRVQVMDAGGYTHLATQISQIENCVAGGANAVVMVAIQRDGMNNLLSDLKKKNVVVVDAVNGVSSNDVDARVLTSPHDEGFRAGEYLAKKFPKGGQAVRVGWLPGPAGAGFVDAFNKGFFAAIKDSAVQVVETKNGDVGKDVQARLVEDILQAHPDVNYLVGTAVMAEAAVPLLRARNLEGKVKLVSIYLTPGVLRDVKSGAIEATGIAPVVTTARMSIDTAVRLLNDRANGKSEPLQEYDTIGRTYTKADINSVDPLTALAPAGFRPIFHYGK